MFPDFSSQSEGPLCFEKPDVRGFCHPIDRKGSLCMARLRFHYPEAGDNPLCTPGCIFPSVSKTAATWAGKLIFAIAFPSF